MTDRLTDALAALTGAAAADDLVQQLAEIVLERYSHAHPAPGQGEDLYCLNLTCYLGERMGPVLVRLRAAESEAQRLRTALADAARNYDRARARAERAEQRAQDAESKLHQIAMVKCWTNEDGKRFVFADDLAAALRPTCDDHVGGRPCPACAPDAAALAGALNDDATKAGGRDA